MNNLTGRTILHYQILEKLGQGSMGVVYHGEDIKLRREVAIKFLPFHLLSGPDERRRFETEAQAAASLNHPNISTIYAIEETGNDVFIVMEYIQGEELRSLMKKNTISFERSIKFAIQIAEAMKAAHKRGIVHRDIKPSNIMITEEDKVKIMDFGLARIIGGIDQTKAGMVLGTAAYMSPEQALGDEVDQRTDIFSFGIVLYEMLSGVHPFRGDYDQAVIYSILNEEPQPLNERIKNPLSDKLYQLVSLCLKKNKNERIDSFEEILKNLLDLTGGTSPSSPNVYQEAVFIKNFLPQKNDSFIGREKEIKNLNSKLELVLKGNGVTVFLSGEPGIGKTQMISYVIKNFDQSVFHVLYGRCVSEGDLPYHPFVNAVKSNLTGQDDYFLNTVSSIASSKGISISNRIPLIRAFLDFSGEYSNTILHKEQLWDSVLVLLKTISLDKPLILILDDIQRADKASLGMFSFIARNINELPIMLIGVHRPLGPLKKENAALVETIRNLKIENLAEKIDLERLSEEETDRVVRGLFGGEPVDKKISRTVYTQSEGNPLFINELINLMKDRSYVKLTEGSWQLNLKDKSGIVSDKVQDVIRQRVDQLDKQSRDILELASCEGEYFRSDILSGCLNMDRIQLLKMLQILESDYHLIRHEKNFYRFDHILIREVLYESILPELREEYHRIISQWLIEKFKDRDEYASRIAYHLISAGDEQNAIEYLITAAIRAKNLYAMEEALSYYERIIKISEKSAVPVSDENRMLIEEGMGDVYTSLGNAKRASEHFSRYLTIAKTVDMPVNVIRALRKLSESYRILGDISKAETMCSEAVEMAYDAGNKNEIIELLNTQAIIFASQGEYKKTIDFSERACNCADEINDLKNKSISLSNMGFAYWHQGNYLQAMEMFNSAISIQRSIGDNRGLSLSLNFLGLLYWKLGKYGHALNASEESVKIKKSIADYRTIPGSLNSIGDIFREIGDLEKAIYYHNESLKLASEHQNKGAMCDNIRDIGEDYLLSGNMEKALDCYLKVLDLASSSNFKWYETRAYISLAGFYLLQNDLIMAENYIKLGMDNADKINARELMAESLWIDALIREKESLFSESCISMERAIEIAISLNYQTLLWKLYLGYSKILSHLNEPQKAEEALRNSKKMIHPIIDDLTDAGMKNTYLNSPGVRELFF